MFNYNGLATSLFGGLVDKYLSNLGTKNYLIKADIKIPFRTYMCIGILNSILVWFFGLIFSIILFQFIQIQRALMLIIIIFVPFVISVVCFIFFIFYPIQRTNSRKKNIEINLPFALTHMGAIAESGIPPYMIFKLLSGFEEYGEIANDMKKMVRNIDTFGIDPLTAIKETAERTPSKEFKQVLLGIATTTESGGDIKTYLKTSGEQALFNWKMKREKFLQQLSTYAEFYTGIVIAAPLFIITLFSVMGMISPKIAGYDILTLTKLSIYILVPLMNIGFLGFLKGTEVEM